MASLRWIMVPVKLTESFFSTMLAHSKLKTKKPQAEPAAVQFRACLKRSQTGQRIEPCRARIVKTKARKFMIPRQIRSPLETIHNQNKKRFMQMSRGMLFKIRPSTSF